ncbi:tail fiber domain-containing protein [Pantoea anthophila]|uniref:tail fiber domain-containing protein n=1 Tax=Pantoea anthophila TaxID=470931 RepID=UPI003CFA1346
MPAGTIALTNNSTAVTGSGTSFTTELKANDFIVAVVGGVTYTLGVQSVNSSTGVTLITAYNGPTASGVAWIAVPNAALVGITAQVAADVAKAIRGLNLDKANWQQVYSASGNITVTLPDGSTYSGPSWNSVVNSVGGKLDKSGGTMTGALFVPSLEISAATPFIDFHVGSGTTDYDVRVINDVSGQLTIASASNSVFLRNVGPSRSFNHHVTNAISAAQAQIAGGYIDHAGSRTRFLNQPVNASGGFDLIALNASGTAKCTWNFNVDGGIASPLGAVVWQGSDKALKHNIQDVDGGLESAKSRFMQIRPREFDWNNNGKRDRGFIAQEMLAIDERYANYSFRYYDPANDANDLSGKEEGVLGLSDRAIMADAVAIIQSHENTINELTEIIKAMGIRLKDLDGLDG